MKALAEFFAGGAARVQALLIAAAVGAALLLAAVAYGLWWRGEAYEARADLNTEKAKVSILTDSVQRCSDSVDSAKKQGDAALALGRDLLTHARSLASGNTASIARIEELMKNPPTGASCDAAWAALEAERKARTPR